MTPEKKSTSVLENFSEKLYIFGGFNTNATKLHIFGGSNMDATEIFGRYDQHRLYCPDNLHAPHFKKYIQPLTNTSTE